MKGNAESTLFRVFLSASLTEASVAQRLDADVSATQQMDQHMIGSLTTTDDAGVVGSSSSSGASDACPARIQVCEAGNRGMMNAEMLRMYGFEYSALF